MRYPSTLCRATALVLALATASLGVAQDSAPTRIRFATFNVALNRANAGDLIAELRGGKSKQAHAIAEIVQRAQPDVLLLNEVDYDAAGEALALLRADYFEQPHGDAAAIKFDFVFVGPVNTGVPTGFDLDRDGKSDGPGDAFGYGAFAGQYGMALLSRFPIDVARVRTFQKLLWRDVPGALWPDDAATPAPADYFSEAARACLRLSSKSHWDVPITVGDRTVHVLACHPTPPVFDSSEDRNGRRNHDELRLWHDYIEPERADWIVDDAGKRGGLAAGEPFVIAGDLNADPVDGDSYPGAIDQLLSHPRIAARAVPHSPGSQLATERQGGANARHRGSSTSDTSDFEDRRVGNLRLDYVLPSRTLSPAMAGVYWPSPYDPLSELVGDGQQIVSSDHRLTWVDVRWPPPPLEATQRTDLSGQPFGDLHGARWLAPFTFAEHDLTLVRWWTTGCPFCVETLAALDTLRQRYAGRGLAVVGMYHPKPPRDVTDAEVRHHAKELGFAGDLAIDRDWDKLADLQMRGAPTTATSISVLVDRRGEIVWFHPGPRLHPSADGAHQEAAAAFAALDALLGQRLR